MVQVWDEELRPIVEGLPVAEDPTGGGERGPVTVDEVENKLDFILRQVRKPESSDDGGGPSSSSSAIWE